MEESGVRTEFVARVKEVKRIRSVGSEHLDTRDYFRDLGLRGTVILKWILEIQIWIMLCVNQLVSIHRPSKYHRH